MALRGDVLGKEMVNAQLNDQGIRAKLLETIGFDPAQGEAQFFLGKSHIYT